MLNRNQLHNYQNRAVNFFLEKKKVALLLDMGLGKTITSLTVIADLVDSLSARKVLIIAPLRVANTVWKQEAENWEHTKHLKASIVTGSEKNRLAALYTAADVYITNRESIEWLVAFYGKSWPFDCVIIDESSSFKNPSSKRFKALKKTIAKTEYCALLTGTPSPNGLLDIWSQYYLLDSGQRLGKNMTAYKQRFFEADYMGYNYEPRKNAPEQIYNLVNDITLSMTANDYIDLPERIDSNVLVDLPPAKLKAYKQLEKDFIIELDSAEIVAESAAVLANKLLQFSNGAIYTDELKNWENVHSTKLDALSDIIADNTGENVLVAYNYKSDLERLKKKFPDAVVMDKKGDAVADWNAGKIKILLAHPMSAGHGLNLQKGGSLLIWFGLTWSLECYQQFNARLHRQGQLKPCRIIHIVANGTIDAKVIKTLSDKNATQESLINSLK